MRTTVNIIGVHRIQSDPPVHLIEVLVRGSTGVFDVGQLTQETPALPEIRWQVAYDEKILDPTGSAIVADGLFARNRPTLWKGDVRLAFFFHALDPVRPLRTPFGEIPLPPETARPPRLAIMSYEPP